MKIKATACRGRDLLPGDLFSTAGPGYWDQHYKIRQGIGEKVYIRTDMPADEDDLETEVYKIEIEKDT